MIEPATRALSFIGTLILVIVAICLLVSVTKSYKQRKIVNDRMIQSTDELIELYKSINEGITDGSLNVVVVNKDGLCFEQSGKKKSKSKRK